MDRQQLENMCLQGLTQREIASATNKSQTTIRYWLAKYDLKRKRKNVRCKQCGNTDINKMMLNGLHSHRSLCKACHNQNTIKRGQANKRSYIEYLGGQCSRCGYNKCVSALELHHKNPAEKDPTFKSIRYWGLKKAKIELDKCILLCANCHREEHTMGR